MQFAIVVVTAAVLAACRPSIAADDPPTARAELKDAGGTVVGGAVFRETPNGVWLVATFRRLPAGTHALHIHEAGRCEAPTFASAGGHFAPAGRRHGFLEARGPHAGDLPNVHIPADGHLIVELFLTDVTLRAGRHSLLDTDGAALVVHAGEDDYRTDPAGDAGDRIACGVIMR